MAACAGAATLRYKVVEDHSGEALISVAVRVLKADAPTVVADLETGSDGIVSADLPEGDYRLQLSKPNYAPAEVRLHLNAGPAKTTVVALARCGVITGQVTDAQGSPVRRASVFITKRPGSEKMSEVRVDERGQYRLFGILPGRYYVGVSYGASLMQVGSTGRAPIEKSVGSGSVLYPSNARPQAFTFSSGEQFTNIDFTVAPAALRAITGKTRDSEGCWCRNVLDHARRDRRAGHCELRRRWLKRMERSGSKASSQATYELLAAGPATARTGAGVIINGTAWFGRTSVTVGSEDAGPLSVPVSPGSSASFLWSRGSARRARRSSLSLNERWPVALKREVELDARDAGCCPESRAREIHGIAEVESPRGASGRARRWLIWLPQRRTNPVPLTLISAGAVEGKISDAPPGARFAVTLLSLSDADSDRPTSRMCVSDDKSRFRFSGLAPGRYGVMLRAADEKQQRDGGAQSCT